jgi:hypothetical protein
MLTRALSLSLMIPLASAGWACALCAIYNANSAVSGSGKGFSFAVSEQFIPYRTVQFNGREVPPSILDQAFVDSSMTHLVPTWSFSKTFSVSLSLPVIHKEFKRFQRTATGNLTESGTESGLGDLSMIGRYRVFQASQGKAAISVSVLAGVKFPTGDAGRLEEEVDVTRALDAIYGVGHQHAVGGRSPERPDAWLRVLRRRVWRNREFPVATAFLQRAVPVLPAYSRWIRLPDRRRMDDLWWAGTFSVPA